MNKTLPEDSKERKNYPLLRGLFRYFPAALAGVAKTSMLGNLKHNPGEEMHHARNKSSDHGDCILRHLMDTEDLLAGLNRSEDVTKEQILEEVNCLAWRALALSQELHEKFGAPLAPGAKKEVAAPTNTFMGMEIKIDPALKNNEIYIAPTKEEIEKFVKTIVKEAK